MTAAADRKSRHWARTRLQATLVLLVLGAASLAIPLFQSDLDRAEFLGFPLGYFLLAQGAPVIFLLLVVVANWRQDAIDASHDVKRG